MIVAVTTPSVPASTIFASATETLASLNVTVQSPSIPAVVLFVINVLTSSTKLASIVVTAAALTFTVVLASRLFSSTAVAAVSVIVTV